MSGLTRASEGGRSDVSASGSERHSHAVRLASIVSTTRPVERRSKMVCKVGLPQPEIERHMGFQQSSSYQAISSFALRWIMRLVSIITPKDADSGAVRRVVGRNRRDSAGSETDDQQSTFPSDSAKRCVEDIAADWVIYDVGAFAIREGFDPVTDIFTRVVNCFARTVFSGKVELRLTASRGDHPSTDCAANFHGGQANATARAVNEKRFAGLQVTAVPKRVMGRPIGHYERGAFAEAHSIGHLENATDVLPHTRQRLRRGRRRLHDRLHAHHPH